MPGKTRIKSWYLEEIWKLHQRRLCGFLTNCDSKSCAFSLERRKLKSNGKQHEEGGWARHWFHARRHAVRIGKRRVQNYKFCSQNTDTGLDQRAQNVVRVQSAVILVPKLAVGAHFRVCILTGEFSHRFRIRWRSMVWCTFSRMLISGGPQALPFHKPKNVSLISAENYPLLQIGVNARYLLQGRTSMFFLIDSKLDQQNLRLSITPREPFWPKDNDTRRCNPLEFKRTKAGVPIKNEMWAASAWIHGVPFGTVLTYTIENKATNDILFQEKIR